MDALTNKLSMEIECKLSLEEAQQFLEHIKNFQFRQAFIIVEKMKQENNLTEDVIKCIERFWWEYAN
jgi:hypothetical protein